MLDPKHLEHLKTSAISEKIISERGYETVWGKTALKNADFSKSQQRAPGILIPLWGVDGKQTGYQYRPDHPRKDQRGRLVKYENPAGASVRLDVPPSCKGQLADPGTPIYITEGVKKVDSLATAGLCAVGVTGVWGFKGKNPFGGTTVLTDFDYIAWKDRDTYIVFDSDITTKQPVRTAMEHLREILSRKGAKVIILQLPDGENGAKIGVDDYLAQGHSAEDLPKLEVADILKKTLSEISGDKYKVKEGVLCWVKQTSDSGTIVENIVPLCDFNAKISQVVIRDNGIEQTKAFTVVGSESSGQPLEPVEVSASSFENMSWVTANWDTRAIISSNQTAKNKLREAMMLQSQDAVRRTIYSHTGWREFGNNDRAFLTASGALGSKDIEVEIEDALGVYSLPNEFTTDEALEAARFSKDFINLGDERVLLPLWAAMYLAPLSEILEPAFTLFIVGHSGSFKSTITALALNHFGEAFNEYRLPASWRDTENRLEKMLFLAKDLPLVIDDWAPGADASKARELEVKAEHVIRAQGNRQGRGRLKSDTTSRRSYIPRGLLITSGEQLPSGHSHTARIFALEIAAGMLDQEKLSAAQQRKHLYSIAMADYILYLKSVYPELQKTLQQRAYEWRDLARAHAAHPRLANAVAWLYAGLTEVASWLIQRKVISESEAGEIKSRGWKTFIELSGEQDARVEDQRPANKFLEGVNSLIIQGKVKFGTKLDPEPKESGPWAEYIGWDDLDGHYLLNPGAAYTAVHNFYSKSSEPFTFKQSAVWKDLVQTGHAVPQSSKSTTVTRIYDKLIRVVKLKKTALCVPDSENLEGLSLDV